MAQGTRPRFRSRLRASRTKNMVGNNRDTSPGSVRWLPAPAAGFPPKSSEDDFVCGVVHLGPQSRIFFQMVTTCVGARSAP